MYVCIINECSLRVKAYYHRLVIYWCTDMLIKTCMTLHYTSCSLYLSLLPSFFPSLQVKRNMFAKCPMSHGMFCSVWCW